MGWATESWALGLKGSRGIQSSGSDRGSAVLKGQGKEAPGVWSKKGLIGEGGEEANA